MSKALAWRSALALLLSTGTPIAAAEVAVERVLTKLSEPRGVAIRPGGSAGRYEVFVAESGAGQVVRFWSNEPEKITEAITGFTADKTGGDSQNGGPTALLFLDRNRLLVGTSGGEARVFVFELHDPAAVLSADGAKQRVNVSANGSTAGDIGGLVRTRANERVPDEVIAALFDGTGSRLQRIPIRTGQLGDAQPFGADTGRSGADRPAAISVAERGFLLAWWSEARDKTRDSRLAFYNPIDRAVIMELAVELNDVAGLAYSPKTGNLYAIDAARKSPDEAGLYRIDAGEPGSQRCTAVNVAEIARPTALAFGPDGALYVTARGEPPKGTTSNGVLLKIVGEL